MILQPRFIPGLAVSLDHFNIKVKGLISTLGFSTVMNECTTEGLFCDLINRDQFGTLWLTPQGFITLLNTNVGGLQTKGYRLERLVQSAPRRDRHAEPQFVGTYLKHLITNPFGDIFYDCAGFYGTTCGTPNPKWRHKARVALTMPNGLGASIQWRHFSGVQFDALSSNPVLNDPEFAPGMNHFTKRDYFDLSFTARMAQKLNLRLGVNNIFDKDPPCAGRVARQRQHLSAGVQRAGSLHVRGLYRRLLSSTASQILAAGPQRGPAVSCAPLGQKAPVTNEAELGQRAHAGNARAQLALGRLLLDGPRAAVEGGRGIALIEQAAAAGDGDATAMIALFDAMGINRPPDWERALDRLQLAAERGSSSARLQLGVLVRNFPRKQRRASHGESSWAELRGRIVLERAFPAASARR